MEERLTGIVIAAREQGDYDKSLVLVTEAGKRRCFIRGVGRPAAKLRFAAELFSLNEYVLASGRGSAVVAGAYNLGMNRELLTDYECFLVAGTVAKLAEEFCAEEDEDFLPFLLKALEYVKVDERVGLLRFCMELFARSGYGLDLEACVRCGAPLGKPAYYAAAENGVACSKCGGTRIRSGVLELLRAAAAGELLEQPPEESFYLGAVRLAAYHLNACTGSAGALENYLSAYKKMRNF